MRRRPDLSRPPRSRSLGGRVLAVWASGALLALTLLGTVPFLAIGRTAPAASAPTLPACPTGTTYYGQFPAA